MLISNFRKLIQLFITIDSKLENRKEEENPEASSIHEVNQTPDPANALANDNRLKFLSFLREQWYLK